MCAARGVEGGGRACCGVGSINGMAWRVASHLDATGSAAGAGLFVEAFRGCLVDDVSEARSLRLSCSSASVSRSCPWTRFKSSARSSSTCASPPPPSLPPLAGSAALVASALLLVLAAPCCPPRTTRVPGGARGTTSALAARRPSSHTTTHSATRVLEATPLMPYEGGSVNLRGAFGPFHGEVCGNVHEVGVCCITH